MTSRIQIYAGIDTFAFYPLIEFVRIWKWRCDSVKAFMNTHRVILNHYPGVEDFLLDRVDGKTIWDSIEPLSIPEIMNMDGRKAQYVFQTVGPGTLFDYFTEHANVELLDKQEVTSIGVNGKYKETYELFKMTGNVIPLNGGNLACIRCACPSTKKTHYLYCDWQGEFIARKDVKAAMASLCYSPVDDELIEGIYRQGEVYLFHVKPGTTQKDFRENLQPVGTHTYWSKLRIQS